MSKFHLVGRTFVGRISCKALALNWGRDSKVGQKLNQFSCFENLSLAILLCCYLI